MDKRRMCPHCRAFITTSDRVCPYCDEPVGNRAIDRRAPGALAGGLIPSAHFVTSMILLINFGLYAATVLMSMKSGRGGLFGLDTGTLYALGAMYSPAIKDGQYWRLITAGFLHGGLLHILMNSWVLFDLGAQVEETYGTYRFLVIYFAATVAGFFLSSHWSVMSVGASAGVFGLLGAMIAWTTRSRSWQASAMRSFYIRWAIYGILLGLLIPMIDNAAHIGGLAGGFAVAYIADTPKLTTTPGERIWQIAAYACLALTVLAFLRMYLNFSIVTRP